MSGRWPVDELRLCRKNDLEAVPIARPASVVRSHLATDGASVDRRIVMHNMLRRTWLVATGLMMLGGWASAQAPQPSVKDMTFL
jgi:hypothetical protein